MSLDLNKLENVKEMSGKKIARCPVCAEQGGDSKSEHLAIFDNGAYHCVATNGEAKHRKRIYELCGTKSSTCKKRERGLPPIKEWKVESIPGWPPKNEVR